MQVKFGEFNDMQNNRDNYGPRNQGKPSRQRKEARENKRYQG